jgi:hypothetical protein
MNNYVIICIGWVLGQTAYACKKSWEIQRNKPNVTFADALHMHFTKETASFAFAVIILLIGLFILPNFVDMDITKDDLKNMEAAKWKVYFVNFLNVIAVVFGYLCQNLGWFFFGKSEKLLQAQADKEGIKLPEQN